MDPRETLQIVLENQLLGAFPRRAGTEERCGRSTRSGVSPEPPGAAAPHRSGTAGFVPSERPRPRCAHEERLRWDVRGDRGKRDHPDRREPLMGTLRGCGALPRVEQGTGAARCSLGFPIDGRDLGEKRGGHLWHPPLSGWIRPSMLFPRPRPSAGRKLRADPTSTKTRGAARRAPRSCSPPHRSRQRMGCGAGGAPRGYGERYPRGVRERPRVRCSRCPNGWTLRRGGTRGMHRGVCTPRRLYPEVGVPRGLRPDVSQPRGLPEPSA